MSTPAYVKKLLNVPGTGKKLFRDRIMDAGFIAHFDFASDYVRDGQAVGAAIPITKTFKNLVDGAATARADTAIPGGLTARGVVLSDAVSRLRLPDSMIFPANETHFAVGVAFQNNTAFAYTNMTFSIAGYGYQTGAEMQWAFGFTADGAGGYSNPRWYCDGAAVNLPSTTFLADGKEHFLVGEFEVLPGATQKRLTVYLDGVAVGTATSAYDGSLNVPTNAGAVTNGPLVGGVGGFQNFRGSVGRIWGKRYGGDPDAIPIATIAAAEYAAYATRFGV